MPTNAKVIRAPVPSSYRVKDIEITHIISNWLANHQIVQEPGPIKCDPERYRQAYGNTLVDSQELRGRIFNELEAQRASGDTVSHSIACWKYIKNDLFALLF